MGVLHSVLYSGPESVDFFTSPVALLAALVNVLFIVYKKFSLCDMETPRAFSPLSLDNLAFANADLRSHLYTLT